MLDLHIANKNYSSWSLRPWILLTELGVPFREHMHPFGTEPFQDFSPTAKVPCLHDGDLVVWDSLAITEYVAESHPAVWPAERVPRAWARAAAAEMHAGFPALRQQCSMSVGVRIRLHLLTPGLHADLARLDALFADGFARFGGPFLAGARFTAADAFFAPVAFRVQTYDLPIATATRAWVDRVLALDGMRAWATSALAETWRDAPHDAEVDTVGTLLADHRAS